MLTGIQRRLIELVSGLPEAKGFALAGGAALILRGIVDRMTHDLDFFCTAKEPVSVLATAAERAVEAAGMSAKRIRTADGFVRLQVSEGAEICELDFSYDARLQPTEHIGGTEVLAEEELAADKTLAVFGRAAARDFVDLAALVDRFGWRRLLTLAAQKDLGFDLRFFLDALRAFERLPAHSFGLDPIDYEHLRSRIQSWRRELAAGSERRGRGWEGRASGGPEA
ncbi:MAG: nucleotidyl transferase AbiEii/AbiGii toxin family protein [Egibacteraceae bacterium]